MIEIGIDAHKKKCVATLKQDSKKILEQITFQNRTCGIMDLVRHVKSYGEDAVAVAKEMLVIMWHMLSNNEPYRTQDDNLTSRKYKKMEWESRTV